MKAAPNHQPTIFILLCRHSIFSLISLTSFSDDPGTTIVTGNDEPRFAGPMNMPIGRSNSGLASFGAMKPFLHVLFCQCWFMSRKVRTILHPLQTADNSLSTDLYIYVMQFLSQTVVCCKWVIPYGPHKQSLGSLINFMSSAFWLGWAEAIQSSLFYPQCFVLSTSAFRLCLQYRHTIVLLFEGNKYPIFLREVDKGRIL
ncbi:hypothetical protein G6F70_001858 [Rhizopus microsporus]|nr:hypothetical protein G6F71_000957 [Rhizopus microsporus]KAG1202883.1 hypothetical protein G6F70_001858 [Rhizopus microsporus]KAG1214531.1 hypothetical protein G6F69_001830 [Rhizopus microsporus]